jgi:hypothetical protein
MNPQIEIDVMRDEYRIIRKLHEAVRNPAKEAHRATCLPSGVAARGSDCAL